MTDAILGLVTTGQGPRDEYVAFHRALLARLGLDVRVEIRHALDGLDAAQIAALPSDPEGALVHCNIRSDEPGASSPLGLGWTEAWVGRTALAERIQLCLGELERAGADVTIVCIAEAFGTFRLRSAAPLVLPWRAMTDFPRLLLDGIDADRSLRVGLFVYGNEQRAQQIALWRSLPQSDRIELEFVELGTDPVAAATELGRRNCDLAILWGYGFGLYLPHRPGLIGEMEDAAGLPVLLPHVLAAYAARNLLRPSLDGRTLLDEGSAAGVRA